MLAQDGPWFRLPGHRVSLSPQDEKLWRAARPLIAAERFRPPRTRDIALALKVPEATARKTLKRLARMGQLIEISPDHFFLRETMAEMAAIAAEIAERDGLLTAASFRDRLNNGRKVAILILEFFDKAGVTIRLATCGGCGRIGWICLGGPDRPQAFTCRSGGAACPRMPRIPGASASVCKETDRADPSCG